jgi:hypothetical protein
MDKKTAGEVFYRIDKLLQMYSVIRDNEEKALADENYNSVWDIETLISKGENTYETMVRVEENIRNQALGRFLTELTGDINSIREELL